MLRVWWKFVGISQIIFNIFENVENPEFLNFLAKCIEFWQNFDRTLMWKVRMVRSLADRTFELSSRRPWAACGLRPACGSRHPSWSLGGCAGRPPRRSRCLMQRHSWRMNWIGAPKLRRARARLYRRRFLQVNTRWKALAEIYTMHLNRIPRWKEMVEKKKMHSFSLLCDLIFLSKFWQIFANFANV